MKDYKRIKTFEDACRLEGLDPKLVIPDFSCYPESGRKALEAQAKLMIIIRVANRLDNDGQNWEPDWSNYNADSFAPWFSMDKNYSPSGFVCSGFERWNTGSSVSNHFQFKSPEVGKYIVDQFSYLYRDLFGVNDKLK